MLEIEFGVKAHKIFDLTLFWLKYKSFNISVTEAEQTPDADSGWELKCWLRYHRISTEIPQKFLVVLSLTMTAAVSHWCITSIIWNSFLKDCVQLCDCLETEILVVHKLPDMVETINQNYLVDIIYLIFQRGGPFIQSPYFWEGKRDLNLMPKYLPLWFFVVIHFMLYLMTRWEAKLLLYSVK